MTEHRWRWSAQARLLRDEFSKHRCLGQECRRLLEAVQKKVSRSLLCLWFGVSQSVMPVERFVYVAGQNALLCGEDVWLCMCCCICVVLMIIICPHWSPFGNDKTLCIIGELCLVLDCVAGWLVVDYYY